MPYIPAEDRAKAATTLRTPGELNYAVTMLLRDYLNLHRMSYQSINDVVGVLECAKLELYRRMAVPYENVKKDTNGDVW